MVAARKEGKKKLERDSVDIGGDGDWRKREGRSKKKGSGKNCKEKKGV